jgi:hypothetical protein
LSFLEPQSKAAKKAKKDESSDSDSDSSESSEEEKPAAKAAAKPVAKKAAAKKGLLHSSSPHIVKFFASNSLIADHRSTKRISFRQTKALRRVKVIARVPVRPATMSQKRHQQRLRQPRERRRVSGGFFFNFKKNILASVQQKY